MQAAVAAKPGTPETKRLLDDAKRYKEQGADKPFLDVWFADESTGFVVGGGFVTGFPVGHGDQGRRAAADILHRFFMRGAKV
jgi:hypothetical protein